MVRHYSYLGVSRTASEWARILKMTPANFRARYERLDNPEEIFSPVVRGKVVRAMCMATNCERAERVLGGGFCRKHEDRLKKHGSIKKRKKRESKCGDKEYHSWQYMKYGKVRSVGCEWNTYEEFLADMGRCPEGMVLCRKDWTAPFSKENCYWGSVAQSRHEQLLVVDGIGLTIKQWSEQSGIGVGTIRFRLAQGWDARDAVNKPVRILKQKGEKI